MEDLVVLPGGKEKRARSGVHPNDSRAMALVRRTSFYRSVDKNVAAEASGFLAVPQVATGLPHPLETEAVENKLLLQHSGIRLGHIGSPVDTLWRFVF